MQADRPSEAGFPVAAAADVGSAALTIANDRRLNDSALRLYLLLREGRSLGDAALQLGKNERWLKRYERQLRSFGYLRIVEVIDAKGRHRSYDFPTPAREDRLAS